MSFKKAVKEKAKLRMIVSGASGAGKTYTSLRVARGLGDKIALVDSEFKSASKYADLFDFDVMDLLDTSPQTYINAIAEAEKAGYDVIVLDSLTHAWESVKSTVDRIAQQSQSKNSFNAWLKGSELWAQLEKAIMSAKIHVICTARAKMEYVIEKDEKSGKSLPKKVGMAPEVRQGSEYAFDVFLEMDYEHNGRIPKTRCNALDDYFAHKPSEALGETLKAWLSDGVEPIAPPLPIPPIQKTKIVVIDPFLTACESHFKRLGEQNFYATLGVSGFENPREVKTEADKKAVLTALEAMK
jgi:AAA domain